MVEERVSLISCGALSCVHDSFLLVRAFEASEPAMGSCPWYTVWSKSRLLNLASISTVSRFHSADSLLLQVTTNAPNSQSSSVLTMDMPVAELQTIATALEVVVPPPALRPALLGAVCDFLGVPIV